MFNFIFREYLKEDIVQKALGLDEPEVDGEYTKDQVKGYIETIKKAIEEGKKMKDGDVKNSIMNDLYDKLKKWQNVKTETKPSMTVNEPPATENGNKQGQRQKQESVMNLKNYLDISEVLKTSMRSPLVDKVYIHLVNIPEFKRLSMDRQGEIAVKLAKMIGE